jgi:TonB family protein
MLVASYVGYQFGMEPINGRSEINFTLEEGKTTLNEVVVVGYEPTPASTNKASEQKEVFTVVEQQPEFPGGMGALGQYLARNIRYPTEARQNRIQGQVFVEFVITQTGTIQDLHVMKGIGGGCDEEAIRVVSQMPTWSPGKQNGTPVNVRYVLPIRFALEGQSTQPSITIHKTGDSVRVSNPSITIRGSSLLDSDRKPLFIVDGIMKESKYDLNALNPNDIESISVLKGASSTAVYGEKGADGVIIIKTKGAKKNENSQEKLEKKN